MIHPIIDLFNRHRAKISLELMVQRAGELTYMKETLEAIGVRPPPPCNPDDWIILANPDSEEENR